VFKYRLPEHKKDLIGLRFHHTFLKRTEVPLTTLEMQKTEVHDLMPYLSQQFRKRIGKQYDYWKSTSLNENGILNEYCTKFHTKKVRNIQELLCPNPSSKVSWPPLTMSFIHKGICWPIPVPDQNNKKELPVIGNISICFLHPLGIGRIDRSQFDPAFLLAY